MKIIAVSDLHLACEKEVDNFGRKQETKFLKFLRYVQKERPDHFFLVGDTYELWQGSAKNEKKRLQKIYKRYWKIEGQIENIKMTGIKVKKVPGNHDWLIKSLYNISEKLFLPNEKIAIMHGHQFDSQYKNKFLATIGKWGTQFWGWVEQTIGANKAQKILNSLEYFFGNTKNKNMKSASELPDKDYIEKAIKYASQKDHKMIIIGHTHKPVIHEDKGVVYINTGTWIDGRTDNIFIDTEKDKIILNRWS